MNQFQDEKEEFWNRSTITKKELLNYFCKENGKSISYPTLREWLNKIVSDLGMTKDELKSTRIFNRKHILIIKEKLA
jgi:hypothetical protein